MEIDEAALDNGQETTLERSFAGRVFRVLGSLLLAGGLVVAVLVIVRAVEDGATFPSGFYLLAPTLVPAGAAVVAGFVLVAVAQVADAVVTTALYTKRHYNAWREQGGSRGVPPVSLERRPGPRPPRIPLP